MKGVAVMNRPTTSGRGWVRLRTLPRKIASSLLSAVLVVSLAPTVQLADVAWAGEQGASVLSLGSGESAPAVPSTRSGSVVASGTWGTCYWEINKDGVLTIYPGIGETTYQGVSQYDGVSSFYHSPWCGYVHLITKVVCLKRGGKMVVAPEDSSYLFDNFYEMKSIDLSGLDTSKVKNMFGMFDGCSSLTSLDLSVLDTSMVENMTRLLSDCVSLESVKLSGLKTSKVERMNSVFSGCSSLKTLDLSGFDTSSVTQFYYTFSGCSSLVSLDVSGFDTTNAYFMNDMFSDCSSLVSLDLARFDTANVVDASNMFSGCSSLKTIKASSGWSTVHLTESDDMFKGCKNLVGGNGSKYTSAHIDGGYARIDANGKPGYLTKAVPSSFVTYRKSGLRSSPERTVADIRKAWLSIPDEPSANKLWSTPANLNAYTAGTLSGSARSFAEGYISFARYAAGIDAITMDDKLNNNAAQGALILARLGWGLTHYPGVPEGVSSEKAYPGQYACQTSNLSYSDSGYASDVDTDVLRTAVQGQLDDSAENRRDVGHRRWLLNPATKTMGIGTALKSDKA